MQNTKQFFYKGSINLLTLKMKGNASYFHTVLLNGFHLGDHYHSVTSFRFINNFHGCRRYYSQVRHKFITKNFNISFYSTFPKGKRGQLINNHLSNILHSLYNTQFNNYISNDESQQFIENLVFDQYDSLFRNYKGYSVGDFNTELLSPKLKSFIIDKNEDLTSSINDFKEFHSRSDIKKIKSDINISPIINMLDTDFIYGICLLHFMQIASYKDSDDKEKFFLINVAMIIGKNMIRKYLFLLKRSDLKYKDISYSD